MEPIVEALDQLVGRSTFDERRVKDFRQCIGQHLVKLLPSLVITAFGEIDSGFWISLKIR